MKWHICLDLPSLIKKSKIVSPFKTLCRLNLCRTGSGCRWLAPYRTFWSFSPLTSSYRNLLDGFCLKTVATRREKSSIRWQSGTKKSSLHMFNYLVRFIRDSNILPNLCGKFARKVHVASNNHRNPFDLASIFLHMIRKLYPIRKFLIRDTDQNFKLWITFMFLTDLSLF